MDNDEHGFAVNGHLTEEEIEKYRQEGWELYYQHPQTKSPIGEPASDVPTVKYTFRRIKK